VASNVGLVEQDLSFALNHSNEDKQLPAGLLHCNDNAPFFEMKECLLNRYFA